VGAVAVVTASAFAAEECVTHYSWKCDDDSNNDCKGFFSEGTQFVYTETESSPHELWYVLRFSPPAVGSHYLRMSGISHSFQGLSTTEEFQAFIRQAAGCTEDGFYQSVTTFDDNCCSGVSDYSLGTTSTTDICIGMESSQQDSNRDELQVDHASGHYHPVIATPFANDNWPDSESTSQGTVNAGSLAEVTRCSPGQYEHFQESGPQHRLWHAWTITGVPSGSGQTLHVRGSRASDESESFNILYKWSSSCSGTSGFSATGISINSDTDADYQASLSNSSGTLCVVLDDASGGSLNDLVAIDHVYVVTTP
jgi:hypothetical protein